MPHLPATSVCHLTSNRFLGRRLKTIQAHKCLYSRTDTCNCACSNCGRIAFELQFWENSVSRLALSFLFGSVGFFTSVFKIQILVQSHVKRRGSLHPTSSETFLNNQFSDLEVIGFFPGGFSFRSLLPAPYPGGIARGLLSRIDATLKVVRFTYSQGCFAPIFLL